MVTSDPESSRGTTEHTPLLGDRPPHVQGEGSESGPEAEPTPEEKTPKRRYAWRIFWILLLLIVIGVFVKGWIDADETEVLALHPLRDGSVLMFVPVRLERRSEARAWGRSQWRGGYGAAGLASHGMLVLSISSVLVLTLRQPLRTIMNYQYRHGTSFTVATRTLYEEGGVRRYYQGIAPALVQGQ